MGGGVLACTIIAEKYIIERAWYVHTPRQIKWLVTFFIIMFSWVLFRSSSVSQAYLYFKTMFGMTNTSRVIYGLRYYFDNGTLLAFAAAAVLTFIVPRVKPHLTENTAGSVVLQNVLAVVLLLMSLIFMINSTYNAFIYFQF